MLFFIASTKTFASVSPFATICFPSSIVLYKTIELGKQIVANGETDAEVLVEAMKANIESEPLAKIDYVKAVNGLTMQQQDKIKAPMLVAMAVCIGKTRLIDNFIIE